MGAGYKTSPVGLVAYTIGPMAASGTFTIIMPCAGKLMAVTASGSTITSVTYGLALTEGTVFSGRTYANEIVKGSTLAVRKFARGSTLTLTVTVTTTLTAGIVTVVIRPEGQVATTPSDD